MKTMKMRDAAGRTNILLGIVGWVSLALGVAVCLFGLWTHFRGVSGPITATYRDDTVYVEVSYGREAKIPRNAELRASLVTPEEDPDAYSEKMAAAMSAMGRDGETAPANAIYHVGFYVGDKEVEPAAPVNVLVQLLKDGFAVGQPIKVVHLGEGDAEVIADTSVDGDGFVSFTTDGFSDFAFIIQPDGGNGGQQEDTSVPVGNGIVGSGRRWTGIMQSGGIEGPSFDEPMGTSETKPIDLNELSNDEVKLTFQYKDESGTWQDVPDGKNIFDYYNTDISITFKFNKQFTQEELQKAGGTLTYDLPPYLTDFSAGQSGKLVDQNDDEAGSVTVDKDGKVTIQLTEDFIKSNTSASDLHFTLSGRVDLDKATDKETGDKKYPGFELEIPTDEREAHSKYGTLKLEKSCTSDAPQRDEDGEWYVDYELTVTAQNCDMPGVRVEDVFDLTSENTNVRDRLTGLIDSYIKYSVDSDSLNQTVGQTVPDPKTDNSVYQTDENGTPKLNWYLGDMKKGESRTLHYRVKLNREKMEETNFTKDGTNLPNSAEAFSEEYPKANTDAGLSLKTHVNVRKLAQENPGHPNSDPKVYFVPDGEGGGYIEYKVTVKNDKDYPVNVKVYDSVNDPNANTSNNTDPNKGRGLSYDQDSFKFDPEKTQADHTPTVEFSKDGDKYTSFTAHIGWLEHNEQITFTYRINISAEELAAGTVNVNNGVLALLEGQDKTNDTYPSWLERYQQNHTVDQESWAAKNFGGAVTADTKVTIPDTDNVYDATGKTVTKVEDNKPDSFKLGENSFMYTVTVNGNTVWDVSSATMGDQLSNGLQYSGYVKVVAKDKDGEELGTAWVKVDGLKSFSFSGQDIGFGNNGAGVSYELTYYTTLEEDNENFHIVLGNNFNLSGTVIGPDGKYINVSVRDSTSNTSETSNHLEVSKDAWYYEPDEDTSTNLGAFYWVVKVDASYIPNGFALRDVTGQKHTLKNDSLLGVYTGPEHEFGQELDWDGFQKSAKDIKFEKFDGYTSQFTEGQGLTVTFNKDYTPDESEYVYLFFKTYVTERQAEPYENDIYSNGDNIPGTKVDYLEDEASNYLPGVGGVEKAGMQVFDWNGKEITFLNNNNTNTADYKLDNDILKNGSIPAGRYAAWSVSVNKTGSMEGDYTITDQIPEGMELSFVAIAKTMHIMQPSTNNTPPWAITLTGEGDGENGLLVGHAKANKDAYTTGGNNKSHWDNRDNWKPWTSENWKYYPSENGRTVSWGVHIENGMCMSNQTNAPISAYEVDYLVVCRVTDPEVLLGVTKGDPEKIFNNHVTVKDENGKTVANADAQLTVPCKPVLTKEGIQDIEDGHPQQTIKFLLKVNEEGTTVEGEKELVLKDQMSEKLVLVSDSVKFYSDPDCKTELTEGVSFTSLGNTITFTIPNGKAVYIQYECLINAPAGSSEQTPVENIVYFEGHEPGDGGETWKETVRYDITGGISGSKTMQITKKDALTGDYLPGAEFEVTLIGTTDENGAFVQGVEETKKYTTGENGISESFAPTEGGLYKIVETKAPEGYVTNGTPVYYWVGKGTFTAPTPEAAGLPSGTKITAMYTGVINVEITNERAKITVKKIFVDSEGKDINVKGTYSFGLFTKDGETYKEADAAYGPRVQSLTFPEDKDKTLTFYVPYNAANPVDYYILELDEDGNPIEAGSRSWTQTEALGLVQFEPSYGYPDNDSAAHSNDAETEVTVTNTCYAAYRLPESGGPGTHVFVLVGLALLAVGSVALVFKKRRAR